MCNITNEDIINFYREKDPYPRYTTKFVQQHRQKYGGYIYFARIFQSNENKKDNGNGLMIFNYQKIFALKQQNNLSSVPSFRKLEPDFIMGIETDQDKGEPNQKWHLLVSYFGQSYLEDKKSNIFKRNITCPELWLWLIETAMDKKEITEEMVKDVYRNAIEYRTNESYSSKDWITFLVPYKCKVKTVIACACKKFPDADR